MITIIDYGLGNLGSVQKAITRIGFESVITNDKTLIKQADALILPGVGNFKLGIGKLRSLELIETLNEVVVGNHTPILGICLGMQLMTSHSEEGDCEGLNWIKGNTKKFISSKRLKVPHMGWNNLNTQTDLQIFDQITSEDFFYFVHSYYITEVALENILSYTSYGIDFVSAFAKDNIFGCQFHPEKSHGAGLKLLTNFCNLASVKACN
ncbi:imidazole glycerol phosphate synthase subunit HisH [Ignavibacteriales bacterium]